MSQIQIDDKKLFNTLITVAATLVFLHIANVLVGEPSWQIMRLMHLGYESNIPTWFSSIILAIAAGYAYSCSLQYDNDRTARKMWQFCSLGFLGMSCDEVAMIHESLGNTINKYLFNIPGIDHSSWSILLGPIVLASLLFILVKMRKYFVRSPAARCLLLGFGVYVGGAFILEATINLFNHEDLEWLFKTENLLEETSEFFGAILMVRGLSVHYEFLKNKS